MLALGFVTIECTFDAHFELVKIDCSGMETNKRDFSQTETDPDGPLYLSANLLIHMGKNDQDDNYLVKNGLLVCDSRSKMTERIYL